MPMGPAHLGSRRFLGTRIAGRR